MDATAASSSSPALAVPPVLELAGARLVIDAAGTRSEPIDLAMPQASFVLVEIEDVAQAELFADAVAGVTPPLEGCVRFLGRDWSEVSSLQAQAMRGRIGQLFARGNWIDGLSVLDNLLLAQLYHTRVPLDELREEAARLAAAFGLPGLPLCTPDELSPADLQRAACVRAFLGRPKLIVLQQPAQGTFSGLLEALINAARAARDREAALLWLTAERACSADASLPADGRYRLRGGRLRPLTGIDG